MAMDSKYNQYDDSNVEIGSRMARNTNLYKEINKTELDNFEVKSNATVIGNNRNNIDVEKIKNILDTHYNDVPQRRSVKIEPEEETIELPKKTIFETKEYDINVILDKAKEDKVENYEEERAKKLHNTQLDILNNLTIDPKEYVEDYDGDSEETPLEETESHTTSNAKELEKLINTITINEQTNVMEKVNKEKVKEIEDTTETEIVPLEDQELENTESIDIEEDSNSTGDPLDIFEDLKGDGTTAVLEGLQERTQQLIQKMEETTSMDESFFTKESRFKKSDFEDDKDFEEVEKSNPIIKIVIIILLVIFIIGVIILVSSLI